MTNKLTEIAKLVKAAHISAASERTVLWCIEQLPALYANFSQTYETRFSEKIARLEQGILGELTDAERLTALVRGRLRALHECHGLQSLDPKPSKLPSRSSGTRRKTTTSV